MRYDKLGDILFSRKYDHTGVIDLSNYIDDIDDEEQLKFIRRYNEKMRRNRIKHFKRRRVYIKSSKDSIYCSRNNHSRIYCLVYSNDVDRSKTRTYLEVLLCHQRIKSVKQRTVFFITVVIKKTVD